MPRLICKWSIRLTSRKKFSTAPMPHAISWQNSCRAVNWSFVSPPARLGVTGGFSEDQTGKYRLGKDDLLMDGEIPAGISVADLAVAIADDAENKAHLFERFTVAAA